MRLAVLCIFLLHSCLLTANESETGIDLVHDWRRIDGQGAVGFISNHQAPLPFSLTGEPEATLALEMSEISSDVSLSTIVAEEIEVIRQGIELAEYLEEDGHTPNRGIVSYYEEIDGHTVAFIKYRARGVKGDEAMRPLPLSVRHAILIKDGAVYYAHLIVLFARHQEEVRSDQIRLISGIIKGQMPTIRF